MEPKFTVQCKIQRPIEDVFDAVYNPSKLSQYFTTKSASAPMEQGTRVIWEFADYPGEIPVDVKQVIPNELIEFEWAAAERDYNTTVEMRFSTTDDGSTQIKITESGWKDNEQDQKSSYSNCEGWSQMCACLKAWLEHGINLRKGYY